MTKEEIEYLHTHPDEVMTPGVFAEAIRLWHERGEPTKANEAKKKKREELYKKYQRKQIENDPYGMGGQDGT